MESNRLNNTLMKMAEILNVLVSHRAQTQPVIGDSLVNMVDALYEQVHTAPQQPNEPVPQDGKLDLYELSMDKARMDALDADTILSFFTDEEYLKVFEEDTGIAWRLTSENKHVYGIISTQLVGKLVTNPRAMAIYGTVQTYTPS